RALPHAVGCGEPQIALRRGTLYVPRLAWMGAASDAPVRPLNPEGTVLITGGTGTLGALVARHVVEKHGVRHLLLLSRQGRSSPRVAGLVSDLVARGARVTVGSCDVADREDLKRWLESVPAGHPLSGVIHAAGVLDDGVLTALTGERVASVMGPKVA